MHVVSRSNHPSHWVGTLRSGGQTSLASGHVGSELFPDNVRFQRCDIHHHELSSRMLPSFPSRVRDRAECLSATSGPGIWVFHPAVGKESRDSLDFWNCGFLICLRFSLHYTIVMEGADYSAASVETNSRSARYSAQDDAVSTMYLTSYSDHTSRSTDV